MGGITPIGTPTTLPLYVKLGEHCRWGGNIVNARRPESLLQDNVF